MTVLERERLEGLAPKDQEEVGPWARTPPSGWLGTAVRKAAAPVALFVVILASWEGTSLAIRRGGKAFLVPSPLAVLNKGLLAHDAYSEILPSFARTAVLALVGLVVAVALGMAAGAVMYRFRWLERASYPYLVALQAVPILAVAPLIAVAFGYSFFAKGLIVVIIAFFPIPTAFLLGLRSVDRGMDDMFRLQKVSWTTRFRKLAFPNALPHLLTGFRISAGLAVVGAIVGEEFFQYGQPGLGMRLLQYLQQVEYERLYGCLILSSVLGVAFYWFFTWLSHRVLGSWHESVQDEG